MRHIYFIRHGQASFEADDYDQLSLLGEEQARLLGDWFVRCGLRPQQIVTGSNRRHRQTAQHCLQQLPSATTDFPESEWTIDAGFDEFNHEEVLLKHHPEFADFTALKRSLSDHPQPRRAFQQMFSAAVNRWISGEHDDYRETWTQFQQRCRLALQRLLEATDEQDNYWIFTSGGTISVLLQEVLGISDQRIFDLNSSLLNSGVSKIQAGSSRISLNYLNNTAHLEIHQRPELLSYR